jgi:cysteine sulfinate desulfinase/cysteine desulfurase-like protein
MFVNDESGVIQDMAAMVRSAAKRHHFHSDAAQATGRVDIDLATAGRFDDLTSLQTLWSGIGALYNAASRVCLVAKCTVVATTSAACVQGPCCTKLLAWAGLIASQRPRCMREQAHPDVALDACSMV